MDINSFIVSHLQAHYKKLLVLCTITASAYLIKKYLDKKRRSKMKKEKKKIKDFPTIEEIQKFIEDLPFDAVNSGKVVTLKDLLGELSEFSEDEDWKELIASVHHMYQDHAVQNKDNFENSGSIISIHEDPNVITLNGPITSQQENTTKQKGEENENHGKGDVEIGDTPNLNEKREAKNLGEGDTNEPT